MHVFRLCMDVSSFCVNIGTVYHCIFANQCLILYNLCVQPVYLPGHDSHITVYAICFVQIYVYFCQIMPHVVFEYCLNFYNLSLLKRCVPDLVQYNFKKVKI